MGNIVRTPTKASGGITEEEKVKLEAHTKFWINNALRTDPIDMVQTTKNIQKLYEVSGLAIPRVVYAPSPLVMAVAGVLAACVLEFRKRGGDPIELNNMLVSDDIGNTKVVESAKRAIINATKTILGTVSGFAALNGDTGSASLTIHNRVHKVAKDGAQEATGDALMEEIQLISYNDAYEEATAVTGLAVYDAVSNSIKGAVHETLIVPAEVQVSWVRPLVESMFSDKNLVDEAMEAIPNWHQAYQFGNMWSSYDCYLSAMRDVIGLTGLDCWDKFSAWEECTKSAGFRFMQADYCIVTDRPNILKKDSEHRPHCDDGPSHQWRDGFSLWHIHGVRVTEQIVMKPDTLTMDQISSESNAEVRRIMVERYGYERYAKDAGVVVVDTCPDDHPIKGLRTAKLGYTQVGEDRVYALDMLNSTPEPDGTTKRYIIPIDYDRYDGEAARNCHAAMASTWRVKGRETELYFKNWREYAPAAES